MSNCIHINIVGDITQESIQRKQQASRCDTCSATGPNNWVCLHHDCLYVGCGESEADHSTFHFKEKRDHCITMNLTTLRVWCYLCECEVFLENNNPPLTELAHHNKMRTSNNSSYMASATNSAEQDSDNENLDKDNLKPRGLTGLQNIGNTCYMNAAIQALSNCPPLTQFFLECGAFVRTDKKPSLSKSYLKLMNDMWHKKRPSYVVPSNISYGIKIVYPMFRGYMQQDSQEFLRCFMDQLHEELKEPVVEIPNCVDSPSCMEIDSLNCDGQESTEESSQSDEAEYETCDSGLSSEKSSCSEEMSMEHQQQREVAGELEQQQNALRKKAHRGGAGGSRSSANGKMAEIHKQKLRGESLPLGYHSLPSNENGLYPEHDSAVEYSDALSETGYTGDSAALLPSLSSASTSSLPERVLAKQILRGLSASAPQIKNHGSHSLINSPSISRFQSQTVLQSGPHSSQSAPIMLSKGSRKKRQSKYRSVISDVFDGKILSSVQCLTCDRISSTKETFQDISLPIPSREYLSVLHASQTNAQKGTLSTCTDVYSNQGWVSWMFGWMKSWFWGPTVSLQDCLAAFFSADELKGDNMYSCEKCKKLRNGIKFSKVLELPEILCIHLKRFRHEVMFSSKISNYVSFPLEDLDMTPFLHKDCPSIVCTYDLVAVICHHGTAGGGHYTSYSLNCISDQWYEFDDQYVTEVDPQVVANCEAYVLFYRKASEGMLKKRQRALELMEISKREPSLMHFYISKQWLNKFNTFSEPSPIDNSDFLCCHGGVHPNKVSYVQELCTTLSQGVWEYLHDSFGGAPACTHLYLCPVCQQELETLEHRRKQELDEFLRLHREFMAQDSSSHIYVISMSWYRIWESFVKGKENEPPGPIDNSGIAVNKNGQIILKIGSDYAQLSEDLWLFLHGIYGGGPQLVLREPTHVSTSPPPAPPPPLPSAPKTSTAATSGSGSSTANPVVTSIAQTNPGVVTDKTSKQDSSEVSNVEEMATEERLSVQTTITTKDEDVAMA